MVKMPDLDVQAVDTMVYQHSDTTGFVTAMFLADSIKEQGGKIEKLVIPYVPGARQDRVNPTGDILFAAKGFADMINARKFSRVIILDPHSKVIAKKIKNSVQYPLAWVAESLVPASHYTGIIAPDAGAGDRALKFATEFGLPVTLATKHRDVSTGALTDFMVTVKPGRYLVVDDICDGGGTFVGLGEKIMEQGAIADLYVTHGIFSKGTRRLHELYKDIYTTDSLWQESEDRVITIPIVERMIDYDTNV
jgi:ribose-phosphate pyrophosphokinase